MGRLNKIKKAITSFVLQKQKYLFSVTHQQVQQQSHQSALKTGVLLWVKWNQSE